MFWPRAVHPLAPPCYAERAVPDLLLRLQYYAASGGRVLLSCHSQGSILGAAVLLQVETAVSARTSFLSYGSPLARLYGGFFPADFSPAALQRLGGFLADAPGPDRFTWRWRNLYRPSDPIGGAVFCERDPAPPGTAHPGDMDPGDVDPGGVDPGDVDVVLRDPVFARPARDPCYPPVLGHELLRRPGLHGDRRLLPGRAGGPPPGVTAAGERQRARGDAEQLADGQLGRVSGLAAVRVAVRARPAAAGPAPRAAVGRWPAVPAGSTRGA